MILFQKNWLLCFLAFSLFLLLDSLIGAVDDEEVTNDHGEVIFHVLDESDIRVPNRHRDKKPSMKLSLHGGATIERIDKKDSSNWMLILSDNSTAELSIKEHSSATSELLFNWHGGGPNENREVCLHYGEKHGFWFNAYQSGNPSWPMNVSKVISKQNFNYLFDYDRYEASNGKEPILIIEHLFVNSNGFALLADQYSPLFIRSFPNSVDSLLCFSVNNISPYTSANHDKSYLDIKLHFFTSSNIRTVTDYVVHQSEYIPKPKLTPNQQMISELTWFSGEMNDLNAQNLIESFSSKIMSHELSKPKSTIIFGIWEESHGEFAFRSDKYPNADSMISTLHQKNFEVGVFFSGPVIISNEEHSKYFVKDISDSPTSTVDLTNPNARDWYRAKVTNFRYDKEIDCFHLFSYSYILNNFQFNDTFVQKYPSLFTTLYIETVSQAVNKIISEYAFKTQHLPVWVRLANFYSTPYNQLLRELIPNVLSVSIAGYSFIVPYSVGGFNHGSEPNEEQFVRMLQAITFMPALSFTKRPWDYSERVLNITKKCITLHMEHVPVIVELAKKRIQDGSPIVRPMWYVAPDDPKTYSIGDQYMLGDDIVVAPVVLMGQTERTVYLTSGTWLDQHGKSYQGPGEFKVAAPLEELPYFKRKN